MEETLFPIEHEVDRNPLDPNLLTYSNRKMWFGKYKGTDIGYLCRKNPDYIHWCMVNVDGFKEKMTHGELYQYDQGRQEKVSRDYNRRPGGFWSDFENDMYSDMIHNLD